MIVWLLNEKVGFFAVPLLHRCHGALMLQSLLGYVLIVDQNVSVECGF